MSLDTSEWEVFYISRNNGRPGLFDIESCKCGNAGALEEGNDIKYIGAKKADNGVMRSVAINPRLVSKGHGIMFICDGEGSVGYTNYIDKDFIGSTTTSIGYDEHLTPLNALFLVALLDLEKYKFSYGRKYRVHLNEIYIKLPIQRDSEGAPIIDADHKYAASGYLPDWDYMESYMRTLHHKPLTTKNKKNGALPLNSSDWNLFTLSDYFDIKPGKYHYPNEYEEGSTPYYSASATNNGIGGYINLPPDFKGDCIITGKIGCTAFYAPNPFCATSDVNIYIPKFNMTPFVGLFIVAIINYSENYKWAYGRQCRVGNSNRIAVRLPTAKSGDPDWQFMEDYIKSLPYGDRI